MKDALRAKLDNAYACCERSTRAIGEEDSTFTPRRRSIGSWRERFAQKASTPISKPISTTSAR